MTPSINRMIKLLTSEEQELVTKERVINLESEILTTFDFDFNYLSPLPFLERFMRLADLKKGFPERHVNVIAEEILKLSLCNIVFLQFLPSQMAAAAFVLA
jgi:hypothetical protein